MLPELTIASLPAEPPFPSETAPIRLPEFASPGFRPRHPCAHVRWPRAITPAKGPVEIGQVAEAGVEGDRGDTALRVAEIAKHAVGAREARAEHVFREGFALAFEQKLNVARRDTMARRDGGDRQAAFAEMLGDVRLYGVQ